MTERRRSTNTYSTWAFVDYADQHGDLEGDFRQVEMTAPISVEHKRRGTLLRYARIEAGLSMKEFAQATGLPDFPMVELSQAQAGTLELSEEEWAACWRVLGREEPNRTRMAGDR